MWCFFISATFLTFLLSSSTVFMFSIQTASTGPSKMIHLRWWVVLDACSRNVFARIPKHVFVYMNFRDAWEWHLRIYCNIQELGHIKTLCLLHHFSRVYQWTYFILQANDIFLIQECKTKWLYLMIIHFRIFLKSSISIYIYQHWLKKVFSVKSKLFAVV